MKIYLKSSQASNILLPACHFSSSVQFTLWGNTSLKLLALHIIFLDQFISLALFNDQAAPSFLWAMPGATGDVCKAEASPRVAGDVMGVTPGPLKRSVHPCR